LLSCGGRQVKHGLKKTLSVINHLRSKGLVDDYAIGGNVGVIFYTEPFNNEQLDVFVTSGSCKAKLTPLFNYLVDKGYQWNGDRAIAIERFPTYFILADELEKEAIGDAKTAEYYGIKTRIMTPEYLVALHLRAEGPINHMKVIKLLEQVILDKKKLDNILGRYKLTNKFNRFEMINDNKTQRAILEAKKSFHNRKENVPPAWTKASTREEMNKLIFEGKERQHREDANIPFEEKIKIARKIQESNYKWGTPERLEERKQQRWWKR
jgi:hypothetical protein